MRVTLFVHGFLGALFVAGLVVAIWQAASPGRRDLTALKVNAIALAFMVTAMNVLGFILYGVYREDAPDSARNLILAGSKPWVHDVLMEFKVYAAPALSVTMLAVVAIVFLYDIRKEENRTAWRAVLWILIASLLLTLVILFIGAMTTGTAAVR